MILGPAASALFAVIVWFLYYLKTECWARLAPLKMWQRLLENLRMLGQVERLWYEVERCCSTELWAWSSCGWVETRQTAEPQKWRLKRSSWESNEFVIIQTHSVSCSVAPESWPNTRRRIYPSKTYMGREKAVYKPYFTSVHPGIIIWVFSYKCFSHLFYTIIKSSGGMYLL